MKAHGGTDSTVLVTSASESKRILTSPTSSLNDKPLQHRNKVKSRGQGKRKSTTKVKSGCITCKSVVYLFELIDHFVLTMA